MKRKSIFTYLGILMITAAILLTAFNLIVDFYYGKKANETLNEIVNVIDEIKEENVVENEPTKESNLRNIDIDGKYYVGIIEMPSIDLSLPVLSNTSEASLNLGPGVYVGTPYDSNFVICAHNRITFFNPIRKLNKGDKVYFMDAYSNVFEYKVVAKDIIHKNDISEMVDSDFDLSLFTCDFDEVYRTTIRLNKIK